MSTTPLAEIVKEYLKKFPSISSKKLSETIMHDIPDISNTTEHIRSMIRYYRGSNGLKNKLKLSEDTYIPKINIPESDEESYEPFVLPEDSYPIIAGADFHIPYHNQDAVEIFLERAVSMSAKTILIGGDLMDNYQVSRYIKIQERDR